ncbi:S-layer homology domain-containing protein [Paenibacillus flagellatus]|uniref:S-layer homology domain-containing protein n=1 Tax=Paenibacillus flagellatus TaxID=2211139 RepID=A0A2V5JYT8_9BACL|nr:S-layer homology domain-containing protein [Paenibacillus flagellatus]PYI52059.1 S-layer homology domain-containing protein [Paenibacillus flagellatus]
MKRVLKQAVVTTMTLAMVVGGAASAFADSKGKGNDKWNDRGNGWKTESKNNGNNGGNGNKFNIIINFNDLNGGDVEWALKNIASLASKRVFEGYEDGTFKPRSTVSRIEAITAAVRLMGLREQAESQAEMSTDLNFKDADKIEKQYPWAVGYVAVAAENDLFSEADASVQPEKAADRLWATTLLVKALKLDAEAKAKMNTKLTFKDADQIPAGSVGYVAVAVERGLVNGFENNTFRPNEPVTRAQLAALLDRTSDQMPDQEQNVVTGTVAAAVTGNALVLTKGGTSTTVALDPNAFIFRNGVRVALGAIQVGDEVRVKTFNNVGIYVEVTKMATPAVDFTVSGRLYSLEWNQGKISKIGVNTAVYGSTTPTLQYYNVDPNYTVIGNAALLVYDHNIEVKGRNQVVTSIEIK